MGEGVQALPLLTQLGFTFERKLNATIILMFRIIHVLRHTIHKSLMLSIVCQWDVLHSLRNPLGYLFTTVRLCLRLFMCVLWMVLGNQHLSMLINALLYNSLALRRGIVNQRLLLS